MKTMVVYYSYSGSTEAHARARAAELGAGLFKVEETRRMSKIMTFFSGCPKAISGKSVPIKRQPDLTGCDRVVIMAPVWAGRPAPAINAVLDALPQGKQVEVVLVSGSGKSGAEEAVRAKIEKRGCTLVSLSDIRGK